MLDKITLLDRLWFWVKAHANLAPVIIFLIALAYYCALAVKSYTWLFVSQDSGDWLAASSAWLVPQPIGSPLYIVLGHLLNLLPWSLETTMPLALSALPAAITVMLVYLISLHMTKSTFASLAASIVILASAVFLTQSTILEEYALAAMFLTLAFYLYLRGNKRLALLALGLATAVHIMGLLIMLTWLYFEWGNRREWLKHSWVYILAGLLPYSYVLVLMALHTPPFYAGYLSYDSLYFYLLRQANGVIGGISVFDFPGRLREGLGLIVMSLGIAMIPLIGAIIKKPYDKVKWILTWSALLPILYYFLALDPTTWTYLVFAMPFLAVLAGIGLVRLYNSQQRVVMAGAILLLTLNAIFLNAGVQAASNPLAESTKDSLELLPSGTVVVTYPGTYSMCLYYVVVTTRPDLIPIVWQESGNGTEPMSFDDLKPQYQAYDSWLNTQYGITSLLPIDQIAECLTAGHAVYIAAPEWMLDVGNGDTSWTMLVKYYLTIEGDGRIRQIIGVK